VPFSFQYTEAQKDAIERINSAIAAKTASSFMLYGITGSGKTEVYLSAIAEALKNERSVIFLLPEISLTPQFIEVVKKRFPGVVGIWHSKLTASLRFATWDKARNGEIKIMLGARSVVFAPLKNLGLIIVDEEHEPSYKQEQKPSYHTREAALERARINNAVTVFGSATPSMELYHKAKTGGIELIELPQRVANRPLPKVNIVDSILLHKRSKILSEAAVAALTKTLARREQAIFFLNRRGFSPGVMCRKCGKVWECPHCSVSLVYHKSPAGLKCHYCDYSIPWPGVCPACASNDVSIFGIGTQKVEEELKKLFPQARVVRLDKDTTSKAGVYEKAYNDFKEENFDILLGTQMVAKGFDFPRVTLVVVVDADTALYLPDFRASERTFQILTQVAGRSGRSSLGGEVIIQTRHPEHYVLDAAKQHDYKKFFNIEIEFRKELGYPPFGSVVNIVCRSKNEEKAKEAADAAAVSLNAMKQAEGMAFEILGPSAASRNKLYGYFRWQLILKGKRDVLLSVSKKLKDAGVPSGVLMSVDVDPQSLL
jgi:primosomal protein N' (replication factor Y)